MRGIMAMYGNQGSGEIRTWGRASSRDRRLECCMQFITNHSLLRFSAIATAPLIRTTPPLLDILRIFFPFSVSRSRRFAVPKDHICKAW